MLKKVLLVVALMGLFPFTVAAPGYAADPPPDQGMPAEPEDPNASPDPPDGVTDPNADYPVDNTEGTDQGETGAETPPPAGGNDAPD